MIRLRKQQLRHALNDARIGHDLSVFPRDAEHAKRASLHNNGEIYAAQGAGIFAVVVDDHLRQPLRHDPMGAAMERADAGGVAGCEDDTVRSHQVDLLRYDSVDLCDDLFGDLLGQFHAPFPSRPLSTASIPARACRGKRTFARGAAAVVY